MQRLVGWFIRCIWSNENQNHHELKDDNLSCPKEFSKTVSILLFMFCKGHMLGVMLAGTQQDTARARTLEAGNV